MNEIDLTYGGRIGMRLKVWWIPQVPGKAFEVLLNSLAEAKVLVEALAQYDLFQFHNKIKPDYCNTGGVMVERDGEWEDWETEDGENIHTLSLEDCCRLDRTFYNERLCQAAAEIQP